MVTIKKAYGLVVYSKLKVILPSVALLFWKCIPFKVRGKITQIIVKYYLVFQYIYFLQWHGLEDNSIFFHK